MDLDIESAVHVGTENFEIRRSLGQTPASSLRGSAPQGQPHESTPPAEPSPPSSFVIRSSREGYFHRSPLSPQILPGGFGVFKEGGNHLNVTPPPIVSASGGSDIQRPELSAIRSPLPPDPSLGVLRTTGLHRIQTATIFDAALEQMLQLPFKERLLNVSFHDLAYRDSEERDNPLVLNFATMYRMRLHKLRSEMVKQIFEIRYHNAMATGWEETLKEYVQAWRDWDYVNECAKRKNDPFVLKSSKCLDAAILREHLAGIRSSIAPDNSASLRQYEKDSSFPGPRDVKEPEILGGLRHRVNKQTKFRAFTKRLAMAALGWVFIVGPMLLMALSDTKVTALCTSSVCVLAFGFLMAGTLERPFDVMSATAAYAAVLVVFVGSNIGPAV